MISNHVKISEETLREDKRRLALGGVSPHLRLLCIEWIQSEHAHFEEHASRSDWSCTKCREDMVEPTSEIWNAFEYDVLRKRDSQREQQRFEWRGGTIGTLAAQYKTADRSTTSPACTAQEATISTNMYTKWEQCAQDAQPASVTDKLYVAGKRRNNFH
ncbi:hypothetical protein ANCCAN_10934 [Ancylostoma caninum]|uniref:Uncharacterized protein n=1 Tax=Ancylostoma caninum TaxID=29170 RepID=A0A368GFF2_ANCCA|nr:hypothetical protein ANCCAN_10934 [Ancylostoma caninum]